MINFISSGATLKHKFKRFKQIFMIKKRKLTYSAQAMNNLLIKDNSKSCRVGILTRHYLKDEQLIHNIYGQKKA